MLSSCFTGTIRDRGDAAVEPGIAIRLAGRESYLTLVIRPLHHPGNDITSGSAVCGIGFLINTMLNPVQPDDGFWGGKWEVLHVG